MTDEFLKFFNGVEHPSTVTHFRTVRQSEKPAYGNFPRFASSIGTPCGRNAGRSAMRFWSAGCVDRQACVVAVAVLDSFG